MPFAPRSTLMIDSLAPLNSVPNLRCRVFAEACAPASLCCEESCTCATGVIGACGTAASAPPLALPSRLVGLGSRTTALTGELGCADATSGAAESDSARSLRGGGGNGTGAFASAVVAPAGAAGSTGATAAGATVASGTAATAAGGDATVAGAGSVSSAAAAAAPGTTGTLGRSTGSLAAPATLSSLLTMVPSGRTVTVRTLRLARPPGPEPSSAAVAVPAVAAGAAAAVATWVAVLPAVWSRETSVSFGAEAALPLSSSITTERGPVSAGLGGMVLAGVASAVSTGALPPPWLMPRAQ